MAEFEQRPGFGSMFKNPDATKENKQPDWKGIGKLPDGRVIELGFWHRTSDKGTKWISVSLKDEFKGEKQKPKAADPFDDVPFN